MHSWLVNLASLLVGCFAEKVFFPCVHAKHDPAFLVEFAFALLSPPVFHPIDVHGVAGVVACLFIQIWFMPLIAAIIIVFSSNLGELDHVFWGILGHRWHGAEFCAVGQGGE